MTVTLKDTVPGLLSWLNTIVILSFNLSHNLGLI